MTDDNIMNIVNEDCILHILSFLTDKDKIQLSSSCKSNLKFLHKTIYDDIYFYSKIKHLSYYHRFKYVVQDTMDDIDPQPSNIKWYILPAYHTNYALGISYQYNVYIKTDNTIVNENKIEKFIDKNKNDPN
ncbi:putative F-box protein [Niemeyer virus]|uniref:F-box protein n=1 Tax=Acanthamoeba polyphaga mimivirus Kroon TaxID=3069720 RepID=A0A0G2Y3K1_9VIRU|nr:putative F-box protein [Acanthamoeba polyphaga mimivirus]AKI80375.1 putative F-box protein [Acanthamoeba polyphaga mimivirus Kroon]ALR84296.1 putative F-box protein [Niemeyer virus]